MSRLLRLLPNAVALFATLSLSAADDPTYKAVRGARPDGRTIAVNNLAFDRDVYHLTLTGTLHLLAPVDGRTFGAVFSGQGRYELKPASIVETRSSRSRRATTSSQCLRINSIPRSFSRRIS